MSRRRRKLPGHYCWACGQRRPNEAYSQKSRKRGVCQRCHRLGTAELEYRQAVLDIDRCLTWEGLVRRKARTTFERFLEHECTRVRAYAVARLADDRKLRAELASARRLDEEAEQRLLDGWAAEPGDPTLVRHEDGDEDIPF